MRTEKEITEDIVNIIEKQIQPSVSMHGGVVSLHSYKDGVVTMFMSGACSGCASSMYTLKAGIENMLIHYVPEVKSVEGVDDPNSQVDPYYSTDGTDGSSNWEPN